MRLTVRVNQRVLSRPSAACSSANAACMHACMRRCLCAHACVHAYPSSSPVPAPDGSPATLPPLALGGGAMHRPKPAASMNSTAPGTRATLSCGASTHACMHPSIHACMHAYTHPCMQHMHAPTDGHAGHVRRMLACFKEERRRGTRPTQSTAKVLGTGRPWVWRGHLDGTTW